MVKHRSNDGKSECIFTLKSDKRVEVIVVKGSVLFRELSENKHWHKRWRNV